MMWRNISETLLALSIPHPSCNTKRTTTNKTTMDSFFCSLKLCISTFRFHFLRWYHYQQFMKSKKFQKTMFITEWRSHPHPNLYTILIFRGTEFKWHLYPQQSMVTGYGLNYTCFTEVTGDSLQNKTATTQKQTKETSPSMKSFSQDTTALYFKIPSSCNTHSALELSESSTENSSLFVCHLKLICFYLGSPSCTTGSVPGCFSATGAVSLLTTRWQHPLLPQM